MKFIATFMGFLWREADFQIGDSASTDVNGGNAYLVVESNDLRLRFVLDRSQLLLEFQPHLDRSSNTWFDVDLVHRVIAGRRDGPSLLDEYFAEFVDSNLDAIKALFARDAWENSRAALREAGSARAKEFFG